jgi:hypothetical protein
MATKIDGISRWRIGGRRNDGVGRTRTAHLKRMLVKRSGFKGLFAKAVLFSVAPWIGLLYSLFEAKQRATPNAAWIAWFDIFLSTAIGISVSVIGWAVIVLIQEMTREEYFRHFQALREVLGVIPAPNLVLALAGQQPDLFLAFLAKEREELENGLTELKEKHVWPLSTPRAYESIIQFLLTGREFLSVDQDIRRWYEIVNEPGYNNTSTTFNYSRQVLEVTHERFRNKTLQTYRRVFVLHPELPCNLDPNVDRWEELPKAMRVLLTIWDFEQRVAKAFNITRPDFGTRVLTYTDRLQQSRLGEQVARYQDIVLIDREVCVHESLSCLTQLVPMSSFKTTSQIYTGGDELRALPEFYEELWKRAQPASAFATQKWLPLKEELQVVDI